MLSAEKFTQSAKRKGMIIFHCGTFMSLLRASQY